MAFSFRRRQDGVDRYRAGDVNELQVALETLGAGRGIVRASGDDDTAAIRAALARGDVLLPDPSYQLSGGLSLPPQTRLRGLPGTTLVTSATVTLGNDGATVADLTIQAAATPPSCGVLLTASDLRLDRVTVSGCGRGVFAHGGQRLTLVDVVASGARSDYGIAVQDVTDVVIDRCQGRDNWLDGLKLIGNAHGVTVRGGSFTGNGQSWLNGGGNTGDGIDAYAGGNGLLLDGVTCDNNNGNGITLKTDSLTRDDPTTYGYVRDLQVIGARCRGNTPGYGLGIYTFPTADTSIPLIAQASVIGGQFDGNRLAGLWLNGRNLSATGVLIRHNQREGLYIDQRSRWVTITGAQVIANGQEQAGAYDGLRIDGSHIRVIASVVLSADADAIRTDADYAGLTRWHRVNVAINPNAVDVDAACLTDD